MNELELLLAQAVSDCAALGAALGGFLGELTNPQIQAAIDTKPEAVTTRANVVADPDYPASRIEKQTALNSLDALIAAYPGGG